MRARVSRPGSPYFDHIWYHTNHTNIFLCSYHDQSGIIYGPEYGQPGTIDLYGPEYDQPVFVWEGNPYQGVNQQ